VGHSTFTATRNKTAAAKVIFGQAFRAYKAIVDRDAFDKEEASSDEFSAGIALPRFMMSGEHKLVTLFLLLGLLFGLPYFAYRFFGRSLQERLLESLTALDRNAAYNEALLHELGVPEDKDLMARRKSRGILHAAFTQVGLLPPGASLLSVEGLPPLKEFRTRLLSSEGKRRDLGMQYNIPPEGIAALYAMFSAQSQEARDADVAPPPARAAPAALSDPARRATVFLVRQVLQANHQRLEAFATSVGTDQLRSVQRLLTAQKTVCTPLDELAAGGEARLPAKSRELLSQLPRVMEDLLSEIRKEASRFLQFRSEARARREREAMEKLE